MHPAVYRRRRPRVVRTMSSEGWTKAKSVRIGLDEHASSRQKKNPNSLSRVGTVAHKGPAIGFDCLTRPRLPRSVNHHQRSGAIVRIDGFEPGSTFWDIVSRRSCVAANFSAINRKIMGNRIDT